MKTRKRSTTLFAALVSLFMLGCSTDETGPGYQRVVEDVEAMLTTRVDKGIFPFTKVVAEQQTTFGFIEGSRSEKVDHATPLKVVVTITNVEGGKGSRIDVEAHEHGLKLKRRDKDAEERWRVELGKVIDAE